ALVALREAVGLAPDVTLDVPAGRLPEPAARPTQKEVVATAVTRRGELVQAALFAQVVCLEVEAQATTHHLRMQTFAAGADIHATQVPQEVHNTEYRPGGVAPLMPAMLAGPRAARIKNAEILSARAEAMVETTRNLIILEAEDAFLRWEEASQQARQAQEAADTADKMAADLNKDFTGGLKVRVDEVVNAQVLASQARSQYIDYLHRLVLTLADLERITAGGFQAGLTP